MTRRLSPLLMLALVGCRATDAAPPTSADVATGIAATHAGDTTARASGPPAPLAPAARLLCDQMTKETKGGFPWDTTGIRIRPIVDTVVDVATSNEWRAACGLEITGGVRPAQLAGRTLLAFIPGEDWGYEPGFTADGPGGGQVAVRRPGAYCVIGEEWEVESDDPADSLLPPPTPAFRVLIRCAGADPIPPEWAPTLPPDFDLAAVSYGGGGSQCYRFPQATLLIYPLPGDLPDRITIRPTTPTACDTAATADDFLVPVAMLPNFVGHKDGVLFFRAGATGRVPDLLMLDAVDHHTIYQGVAAAIVGFGPGGTIGVYRPAPLTTPHPLCERVNIDFPRIDSLFWVDIHTGRARFSGETHCPSYR